MNKGLISNILRSLGLMRLADMLTYMLQAAKFRRINREFRLRNPGVDLPPAWLVYESFRLDYKKYYTDSIDTTRWLTDKLSRHMDLKGKRILDWGCGPGRIIRHLPGATGNSCEYYGTDSNARSVSWCMQHLPGIAFNTNDPEAALPYDNDFFDAIYGVSVFTHLSERLHFDWYRELSRVLKPGGIMLFTTQGDNFMVKLTAGELKKYLAGQLVTRGRVKVGHRTFSAFHPPAFMRQLFADAEILEHIVSGPEPGKALPQDVWIVKKKIN